MSLIQKAEPIRVGVLTDEPLRLVGLNSIFEQSSGEGYASLTPVIGQIDELLADPALEYLVVDLNSSNCGLRILT